MWHMRSALLRPLRLLLILQLLLCNSLCSSKKYRHYHPRRYNLTLSVRNHNVTEAKFFRLNGVGNTADFVVAPGDVFTKTYEVKFSNYRNFVTEIPRNFEFFSEVCHRNFVEEIDNADIFLGFRITIYFLKSDNNEKFYLFYILQHKIVLNFL